ncbi:hypothetical protein KW849_07550 [Pseudomonas sp. PDM26]|uniref:DUF6369 family protein n=1 Tax=Pseudomonas sp. PDM26 TaxID=2854766 RepID=UPI001C47A3D9|nr:DUF6369 family protein [Pseudomonas sp. PDM26]MBV7546158.1 hypothetical protein [Pseudomonas sp. PDM26]
MTYIVLSLLFLCLGLLREKGLLSFLMLIACLPFSNSFSIYFYQYGLYSYDYFFFGVLISTSISGIATKANAIKIPKWATISFLIIAIYSVIPVFSGTSLDVYFLRDYRPAIFALELIAASLLLKSQKLQLSNRNILTVATLAGATNLVWLALSIAGVMSSEDEYYTTNNFKYFDASTYISALFIIYFFSKTKTHRHPERKLAFNPRQTLAIIASLLSVILSGYRILAFATIIAAALAAAKSPKKLIPIVIILAISALIFIYLAEYFGAARVAEGLTANGLLQQFATRYGPALDVIASFKSYNYIFGSGFGTSFDITWFEYRSLDTRNNFVDSAYITFFAKYGLLGILYITSITLALLSLVPKPIKLSLLAYLLILFIAYAISYQPASAGIIIGCMIVRILQSNSDNTAKV